MAPTPCTSDVQCVGATSCQIAPNAAMNGLTLACAPVAGPSGIGVACTANGDCRDGLCIGGYCSGPCASNADCTQAGICESQVITVGGVTGSIPVCVVSPCTSNADCPTGEACSEITVVNGNPTAFCRAGLAGGSPVGTTCANGATCASLLCPTWLLSCTQVCKTTADCAPAAGEICVDMFGGSPSVEACAPACARVSDCAAGTTCVFSQDTNGDQDAFTCGTPRGAGATGTSCATTNTCASGLCLSNYTNGMLVDQICTQPCVVSADCPAAYPVCTNVNVTTPSGKGMQVVSVCDHT